MFVIGATKTFDFQLVGRVSLAEVIAFTFVPFFWLTKRESWINGNLYKCIWLLALLFFGIIISDLINDNYFWFSARAFARPLFMVGFLLFFIPVLRRDPLSLIYMVYGGIIGGVLKYFRGSTFETADAMVEGTYAGVAFRILPLLAPVFIAASVFIYARSRVMSAGCFILLGALLLYIGAPRSSLLVVLATMSIIFLISKLKSSQARRIQLNTSRKIALSCVIMFSLSLAYFAYIYTAPRGLLGDDQRIKYMDQANQRYGATPWGLILSGRAPVYGAILGIIEKPIVGFGSWRHDLTSAFVIDAIVDVGADSRVLDNMRKGGEASGAGHSVLFQAWVENGILPAIAYLWIYWIFYRVFIFSIKYDSRITPFIIFTFVSFTWAFLFSPPDLALRFNVGLFMAIYVVYMDKKKPLSRVDVLSA
jgi:hypothetical protein